MLSDIPIHIGPSLVSSAPTHLRRKSRTPSPPLSVDSSKFVYANGNLHRTLSQEDLQRNSPLCRLRLTAQNVEDIVELAVPRTGQFNGELGKALSAFPIDAAAKKEVMLHVQQMVSRIKNARRLQQEEKQLHLQSRLHASKVLATLFHGEQITAKKAAVKEEAAAPLLPREPSRSERAGLAMYGRAREIQAEREAKAHAVRSEQEKKEMEACSFQPTTTGLRPTTAEYQTPLWNRPLTQKKIERRQRVEAELREKKESELKECTFRPAINAHKPTSVRYRRKNAVVPIVSTIKGSSSTPAEAAAAPGALTSKEDSEDNIFFAEDLSLVSHSRQASLSGSNHGLPTMADQISAALADNERIPDLAGATLPVVVVENAALTEDEDVVLEEIEEEPSVPTIAVTPPEPDTVSDHKS